MNISAVISQMCLVCSWIGKFDVDIASAFLTIPGQKHTEVAQPDKFCAKHQADIHVIGILILDSAPFKLRQIVLFCQVCSLCNSKLLCS
jgi:hypothetical protein